MRRAPRVSCDTLAALDRLRLGRVDPRFDTDGTVVV